MKKKMKKKNGPGRRILALMLCCFCLLAAIPAAATVMDTGENDAVEEVGIEPHSLEGVEEGTPVNDAEATPAVPEESTATPEESQGDGQEATPTPETGTDNTAGGTDGNANASEGNTDAQPTPDAVQTPTADTTTESDVEVSEVLTADSLFNQLMSYTTYDELNAALNSLTEEEEALLDQFTEEQNAALEAKVAELGGYDANTLETRNYTIAQGGAQSVTISNMTSDGFSFSCSQTGITAKINSSGSGWNPNYTGYTISVGSTVPVSTYTLTVTYQTSSGSWFFPTTTTVTDTITITVTKSTKSATINSIVSNAVVTYYYYTKGQWVKGGTYTDGQTITIAYNKDDDPSYYVFFAKPADNYLLSEFSIVNQGTGRTSYDLYSVENVSQSNISEYPNINSLVQEASNNGYLTMNGYRTSAAGSVTLNQYFTGTQPGLTVSATATPNENVKPEDEVTFNVMITPQKANTGDTVTSFKVTSLTINGVTYKNVTLTANGDGTYSTSVKYIATQADWQTGNISLNVSAQVGYEYVLPLKDRDKVESQVKTNSTITSSGTTMVTLATASGVAYKLEYDAPDGITPPNTIPAAPTDDASYYEGSSVTVKGYNRTEVDDPNNYGTWTFTGWKVNGEGEDKNANDTVTMGSAKILFVGTWTFKSYPPVDVTILKKVTGNMANQNDSFKFTVTKGSGDTAETIGSFELKHEGVKTIQVNVGDTITVTEENGSYVPSYVVEVAGSNGKKVQKDQGTANSVTYTVTKDAVQLIAFTNKYEVTIETGIFDNSMPYVIVLAVVLLGGVMFVMGRRRRYTE